MPIYPWISGEGVWAHVHKVWADWQSLNVGVLAFLSSVIAFNISRFNANKQREREFIAARAFLPEALSELIQYFKQSALVLIEAWEWAETPEGRSGTPLAAVFPELPEGYKETFSRCIEAAEADVGDYLAYILMRLQVHHARLGTLRDSSEPGSRTILVRENIKSYLYRLGELQALINKLFGFARGLEPFDGSDLVWEDFRNAYANLDVWTSDIGDLVGFTERALARGPSKIGR